MPITANDGGVLRELETVTVNESGVLYELDTVHANGAGVLYEVHSAVYFPDSLTWRYGRTDASAYKPTVSDNGLTVSNTYSSIVCNYVVSDVFEIKGSIKIRSYLPHGVLHYFKPPVLAAVFLLNPPAKLLMLRTG